MESFSFLLLIVVALVSFHFGVTIGAARAVYPKRLLEAIKKVIYKAELKGESLAPLSIEELSKRLEEALLLLELPEDTKPY